MTPISETIPAPGVPAAPPSRTWPSMRLAGSVALRALLLGGCAVAAVIAAWLGQPADLLLADPELAFLLRGMASIKAAIVLAAVALLSWRFGHPVAPRIAVLYLLSAWLAAGSVVLVWQLSLVAGAAVAFHVAELTGLFVAWRDHRDLDVCRTSAASTHHGVAGSEPPGTRLHDLIEQGRTRCH